MCQSFHRLAADRHHLATRLISGAEIVLLRFAFDHVEEELAQFVVARSSAQWTQNIKLKVAAKTGSQLTVAGKAQLVAALTKMQVGHRANEPDALPAPRNLIISSRAIGAELRLWHKSAKSVFDCPFGLSDRKEICFA